MSGNRLDAGIFIDFLRTLVPPGGAIVPFASVFIDESGTHSGSPALVLAGYLFERRMAARLDVKWRKILARERMPYLHMADFTKRESSTYAHIEFERRSEIEKEFIWLIKNYASFGFATYVNESIYRNALKRCAEEFDIGKAAQLTSGYSWLWADCFTTLTKVLRESSFKGKISYIFESGHDCQGYISSQLGKFISANRSFRAAAHYLSHSFAEKQDFCALQAADLLAWLTWKWVDKCEKLGIPSEERRKIHMRKDLQALFGTQQYVFHEFDAAEVETMLRFTSPAAANDPPWTAVFPLRRL